MAQIIQVDAFSTVPFAGNPAAVCVLSQPAEEGWMQSVAAEMNLSETAFLHPEAEGYRLRWFTPAAEVDLCGHATLASAHVLWSEGVLPKDAIAQFYTRSGVLTAVQQQGWIQLDFPRLAVEDAIAPPELPKSLRGMTVAYVGRSGPNFLIEVASEDLVRALRPDMGLLRLLPVQGVIVTSRAHADTNYDFVSRYFAPQVGINEDPVTGSTHCSLAPYWQQRLGKTELMAYQASARGGELRVQCQGDRVMILGQAVTVMRGELVGF
jgi:predicted PhzF superfamily epimerase YddE/YHI9